MPQTIAKIGREKTLKTLTRNIFVIDAQTDPAKIRNAEAALLRANPQLSKREGFTNGATVAIPGNVGLRLKERDKLDTNETAPDALDEATVRLQITEKALRDSFALSNKNIDQAMATLKDRTFARSVAKQSEKGTELLKAAAKRQIDIQKKNKNAEEEMSQILKESMVEIEALRKMMKG